MLDSKRRLWIGGLLLLTLIAGLTQLVVGGPLDDIWGEGFEIPQKSGGTLYATCLAGYYYMVQPNQMPARVLSWPIYEPIIQNNWDGKRFVPGVAESWEISEDLITFTFHIRPDALWHDGAPVTAHDVVFTYNMLAHPQVQVQNLPELEQIEGYDEYVAGDLDAMSGLTATDELTVVIKLKSPNAEFLQGPAKAFLHPKHILGSLSPEEFSESDFWLHPIGTGPFKFVNHAPGEYVTTERFEEYYRGTPYIEKIVVRQIPEEATEARVLALLEGSLDIADHHWQLTKEQQLRIEADPKLEVLFQPSNIARGFTWKETKPYLTTKVRRALMMAINDEELIETVVGYGTPCQTFVPSVVSPNIDTWEYNAAEARRMLEEEGWDFNRELSMVTYYGDDRYRNIMLAIANYWSEIGVQCSVTLVGDWSAFNVRWQVPDGDDICFCGIDCSGVSWSTIDHYIHSQRTWPTGFNTFYSNPAVDALIAMLRQEADPERRIQLLYWLEEMVHYDVALAPIWAAVETRVINTRLHNYCFNMIVNMPSYFGTHLWWLEN